MYRQSSSSAKNHCDHYPRSSELIFKPVLGSGDQRFPSESSFWEGKRRSSARAPENEKISGPTRHNGLFLQIQHRDVNMTMQLKRASPNSGFDLPPAATNSTWQLGSSTQVLTNNQCRHSICSVLILLATLVSSAGIHRPKWLSRTYYRRL